MRRCIFASIIFRRDVVLQEGLHSAFDMFRGDVSLGQKRLLTLDNGIIDNVAGDELRSDARGLPVRHHAR
jgi:hypothetical protein